MALIEVVIIKDTMWNQLKKKVSEDTRITKLEKANKVLVMLLD